MKIIIPMSGFGERFRRAGYKLPKPLIKVDEITMIEHVVKMFSKDDEFIFICNKDHLKVNQWKMREILLNAVPNCKIIDIEPHKKGPAHAVLKAKHLINPDEKVIVNYCDFSCYWDYENFKKTISNNNCSGSIPAYKGFHPHSLGTTNYAYIKEQNNFLLDIKEKEPFTNERMNEYASSGTYYFSSGSLLIDSLETLVKREELSLNGEYYISLAYKILLEQKKNVYIFPIQHFMQWGTPQDLQEYQLWSNTFNSLIKNDIYKDLNNKNYGSLILPMAGLGKRFSQSGYKKTKPLIEVSGKPMLIQAVNDLPKFKNHVFVLRRDMPELEETLQLIKINYPEALLKIIPGVNKGQAISVLDGITSIEKNKSGPKDYNPLTVSACDNGVLFNEKDFQELLFNDDADIIVWGYEGYPNSARNPEMYGWIDPDKDGIIKSVSVKKSINSDYSKPIIIGTFTFKRIDQLKIIIKKLLESEFTINGEYYLDECINIAIKMGLRCKYFKVENFICWGTPNDLKTFEYWQSCFHKWHLHKYSIQLDDNVPKNKYKFLENNFKN